MWLVDNIKIIDGKSNILQLIKKLELDDLDNFFVVLNF